MNKLDAALGFESSSNGSVSAAGGERKEGDDNNNTGDTKSMFLTQLFSKLIVGTKAANALPPPDDFKYYESFPSFHEHTLDFSSRLLSLIGRICDKVHPPEMGQESNLQQLADDEDRFQVLTDTVDTALERVDLHLDDMLGLNKNDRTPLLHSGSIGATGASSSSSSVGGRAPKKEISVMRASKTLMKPQTRFKEKPDNSHRPFIPILKTKPHAIKPLAIPTEATDSPKLPAAMEAHLRGLGMSSSTTPLTYSCPYQFEIEHIKFMERHVTTCKETLYRPLGEVPVHWVDTEEALQSLAGKLDRVTEFAVDLEHHNYRTYLGFTCLMQISTRSEDFLIDTLELRHHMHVLAPAFADARIVKVLHGADWDIQWLQRDFGIYVVNLFDTGQASRVMEFPAFGLAYLLKHYCDVSVNKKYQLADWRIRPLSAEMLHYAREDTHYLLYVYDRMKNEAIEYSFARNQSNVTPADNGHPIPYTLNQILERSKQISLKTFEKEIVTPTSHMAFVTKYNLMYSEQQMRTLQALYTWRDTIARNDDESVAYVLPNHVLINICHIMPLDTPQLLAACQPVPPLVRQYAGDIVKLIQRAKLKPDYSPLALSTSSPASPSVLSITPSRSTSSLLSNSSVDEDGDEPLNGTINVHMAPTSNSPVQSTDMLYQGAGWIGQDGGPEGPAGVPLFDISALMAEKVKKDTSTTTSSSSSQQSNNNNSAAKLPMAILATPTRSAFMDFSDDSDTDDDADEKAAKIQSVMAPESLSSLYARMSTTPAKAAPAAGGGAITTTNFKLSAAAPAFPSPPPGATFQPITAATIIAARSLRTPETGDHRSTASPSPPSLAQMPSPMGGATLGVPASMREVYKISNDNRRRNRQKKKLKKDDGSSMDAGIDGDDNDDASPPTPTEAKSNAATGGSSSSSSSAADFMARIGWTDGAPSSGGRSTASSPANGTPTSSTDASPAGTPSSTTSGSSGKKVRAFPPGSTNSGSGTAGVAASPSGHKRKQASRQYNTHPPGAHQRQQSGEAAASSSSSAAAGTTAGATPSVVPFDYAAAATAAAAAALSGPSSSSASTTSGGRRGNTTAATAGGGTAANSAFFNPYVITQDGGAAKSSRSQQKRHNASAAVTYTTPHAVAGGTDSLRSISHAPRNGRGGGRGGNSSRGGGGTGF